MFETIKKLFNLGYSATDNTARRKPITPSNRSEDWELWGYERSSLISGTRDLIRNMSAARWAINKHLDYCSTFYFQSTNQNEVLDKYIEDLFSWWFKSANCDLAGRHHFSRLIRLSESRATVDGDILLVKTQSGHIQAIEADRIRSPFTIAGVPIPEGGELINGVVVDQYGKAQGYVICKRVNRSQYEFDQYIPAEYCLLHGYFDRFDQSRGISPLASALNSFKDVMEASEYALIKAKIASLFGCKIIRGDSTPLGEEDEAGNYNINPGQAGWMVDLKAGDNLEMVESQHPSTQFQDFMNLSLASALKALDIPYSMYSEDFTNYSGSRSARLDYQMSVENKRANLRLVLDDIVEWKLNTWVASGLLKLPAGMTVKNLNWQWHGSAMPLVDPLKERNADVLAVNAGLTSRQRLCRQGGADFNDIVKELQQEKEMLEAAGLNPTATPLPILDIQNQQ